MRPWGIFIAAAAFVLPLASQPARAAGSRQAGKLQLHQPVTRELGPGQTDVFTIDVLAGQFVNIVAEQQGLDVILIVAGPNGKRLLAADSANFEWGPEPASWIAQQTGIYVVKVLRAGGSAGKGSYRLELTGLHRPRRADRRRIEAERASWDALSKGGTKQDNKAALRDLKRAASLWGRLKDRYEQALSVQTAGVVYQTLGERGKALDRFRRSLRIFESIGSRRDQAVTLRFIGAVHNSAGENQKALDDFTRAVALYHGAGDCLGEGTTLTRIGLIYSNLGDRKKALDYCSRALPPLRAAGDGRAYADTLNYIGVIYANQGDNQQAVSYYNQALPLRRKLGDKPGEANELFNIGDAYYHLGEQRKALDSYAPALTLFHAGGNRKMEARTLEGMGAAYFSVGEMREALQRENQALSLYQAAGDRTGEARMLESIGLADSRLGDKQKALDQYNQALAVSRAAGNRPREAIALNNIGGIYEDIGEMEKALDYREQALLLFRALGNRRDEAVALNNIGLVYSLLGQKNKALDYFNQSLSIRRAIGDRFGEAVTLNNIALDYAALGQHEKALEYYRQALPIRRAVGDRSGEAVTLNNIGLLYSELGDQQKALAYYNQALPIRRAVGDRSGEAATLLGIARIYSRLRDYDKALEDSNQALLLFRALGDRRNEAVALSSIGVLYAILGQTGKALEYYEEALPIRRAVGDRSGEGTTLSNIGRIYSRRGDQRKALEYYEESLPLLRSVGDRSGEAVTLSNMSWALNRLGLTDAAILFGKQAVNVVQSIRRDDRQLSDELQHSYAKSVESIYRHLAGLLVERQRFGEAEQVLDLLKNREANDFIQRDAVADQLRPATLTEEEKRELARYEQIVSQVIALGQQEAGLMAKRDKSGLSPAEVEQSARLSRDLADANATLLRYLREQQSTLAPNLALAKQIGGVPEVAGGIQKALRRMPPDVVAIYTLVMPDKYIAILVTSGARKAYTTPIRESDLNRKIFAFRQALQNPASDPLPLAQELYRIVFPPGLRQDLDAIHADAIMWSVDSTLRYIPIAALYDGKQYLVHRFRNSLITPASIPSLTDTPAAVWQGAGFGVSEAKGGFRALPSVPEELHAIFGPQQAAGSPIVGTIRLNAQFTRESFENDLRSRRNPVVHIATHFDAEPGVAANSHLLLGDGTEWSLDKIAAQQDLFEGVDLLTLSACSTGFTNGSEDGREVDSFGTLAQQIGAKAVIASLWSVNDEATARLMGTMYRLWEEHPELGKSEALRQAQLAMLTGALRPGGGTGPAGRGLETPDAPASRDWRHPFYWAPFILIGNWK
jgi:CHAT domain-containing protein/Tfp pilus assembly protein PilF